MSLSENAQSKDYEVTPVFTKNRLATTRIKLNQGSTRSSKTYSILQLLIMKCTTSYGLTIDVIRKTTPALKLSVLDDFLSILNNYEIYNLFDHNKSDNIFVYRETGSRFRFYGVDDPQKIRGRKRDIGFLNECNELTYEDFKQIAFRTRLELYMDFNPSDEYHWIYDSVMTRDDCTFIHSTYKDNTFLTVDEVKEIERLQIEDPDYWRVFGLGERGQARELIFTNWRPGKLDFEPEHVYYGLDFGHTNPSALVRIYQRERRMHLEQLIYKTRLTNTELISEIKRVGVKSHEEIFPDAAEPDRIQEIIRAGYKMVTHASKDVKTGIDYLKRFDITVDGPDLEKELKNYKNKIDRDGRIQEEPVKFMDHAIDATRYGAYTYYLTRLTKKKKAIRHGKIELSI